MARVALLGTGLLGSGFAEGFLTRGGTELTVWNRTRAKAEPLAAKGARVAETPAEAVEGAERVHFVLRDDDTVDAAIESLLPGLGAGVVLVDHTTNLPARTAERARRLTEEGIEYLHAPVFMSPQAARTVQGHMLVAGPTERFERVKAALASMTADLWYVGERPDLAAAYKLFGNAMIVASAGVLADIFHMCDALGVPRNDVLTLFSRFNPSGGLQVRGARIVAENYEATFTLEMSRKDVRLMLESADGEPAPMLSALAARMDQVIADGLGGLDMAVLAKPGV